mgnify:CR=1 FL=1
MDKHLLYNFLIVEEECLDSNLLNKHRRPKYDVTLTSDQFHESQFFLYYKENEEYQPYQIHQN